jgi:hypothetical protein
MVQSTKTVGSYFFLAEKLYVDVFLCAAASDGGASLNITPSLLKCTAYKIF